ncbi:Phage tail fibre adhesin Gp38 [uncultured Mediterranean phage uvMED]|nr:Phage tail fibre adhesin Gp38 [uncultured Mediterranean phage uvMED]
MTLPSSGTLTINNIVGEFGGSAPHGLSEYYRNGGLVTPQNTTVPTSGAISISDFYGTVAQTTTTITTSAIINGQSNRKEITASDFITAGNKLRIPSGFWIWSDDVTVPALTIDIPCEIQNEGKIIGKGGYGSFGTTTPPQDGGIAIKINSAVTALGSVIITNASGAFIAGGGGGGGGSGTNGTSNNGFGGGGAGGGPAELGNPNPPSNAAQGGVLNAKGGDAVSGTGGGAGGGGGSAATGAGGFSSSGGGGGRILGSGATGGVTGGGANGNAGASSSNINLGGGGGGWGAAGGNGTANNGGAGGKAIEDTGNTYTLSNSGTIYGATT